MAAPLLSASSSMNAMTVSLSSFQADEIIRRPCSIHWLRDGTFEGAKGLMHEPWSQKNDRSVSFEHEYFFPHRVEPAEIIRRPCPGRAQHHRRRRIAGERRGPAGRQRRQGRRLCSGL